MAQTVPRESLDETADKLVTTNPDGTYIVLVPAEGDRVVTVPEQGTAKVIAMAAAAQKRPAAIDPTA
ncbi:hypothetical protein [Kocuria arenosa]|uniref:hypothetical protein n=1 Tax=Kocuria arenosa TaxID=3071446 RepID=UPI0034D70E6C